MAENIKYINADELSIKLDTIRNPDSEFVTDDYIDGFSDGISAVIKELETIPTTDVAEVVRCKDCKWYKESKLLAPNKFCFRLKDRNGDPIGYNFSPDEFCSYGERKELDNGTKNL